MTKSTCKSKKARNALASEKVSKKTVVSSKRKVKEEAVGKQ